VAAAAVAAAVVVARSPGEGRHTARLEVHRRGEGGRRGGDSPAAGWLEGMPWGVGRRKVGRRQVGSQRRRSQRAAVGRTAAPRMAGA